MILHCNYHGVGKALIRNINAVPLSASFFMFLFPYLKKK